jgi:mono/diheme cytochrome c family protein
MTRWFQIFTLMIATAPWAAAAAVVDFEREVQPLLQKHCIRCHGPQEQNGGLRYDDKTSALGQADSGKFAIVPGHPKKSELLRRITSTHKDEQMPPKGQRLSSAEVGVLTKWISAGARWPQAAVSESKPRPGADHWSFQPLQVTTPPEVKDPSWAQHPVDRFTQSKRESAGLAVAPDAAPAVLLRRLSYGLTGLPPNTGDLAALSDGSTSIQQIIDRLLASPHYGERWGRHWMDWVRYADTAGDNSDYPIPQAYLYRKYIIESLNRDLPYDRFLTEQLAGDLLPAKTQAERNRLAIATGYLAMARRFGSLVERYPWHLTIEDTLDNLGRTVMGLTVSCARCHDHKFDPISTRDYYGLYGIFASTRYPFPGIELFKTQRDFVPLIPAASAAKKHGPYEKETKRLTEELNRCLSQCEELAQANAREERSASLDEQRRNTGQLDSMMMQARKAGENLAAHLKKMPTLPTAYAVGDAKPVDAAIHIKGEPERPGAVVPRKFLDVLGGHPLPKSAQKTSGRLELAKWLTDATNPLTARVIVNRVWQRHFGIGLVPTTSDFGLRGERPTHPELLDWLAADFMEHGWSLKHLHRRILSSRTWQLSSQDLEDNVASDPANTLYWKHTRQRLDAESLRDTLLLLGDSLDLTPQTKPYPIPPSREWKYTQHHPFKDSYPSQKRSVYLMTKRLTAQPYFQTFDGADPNVCTTKRDTSVTALQALFFANDEVLHEQAAKLGKKLAARPGSEAQRLREVFLGMFVREPENEESELLLAHLTKVKKQASAAEAWSSLLRSLFRLNEFLYLD